MKKFFIIGLCVLCFSSFSQTEWELIHGSDSVAHLTNVFMTDENHTWGNYRGSVYFSQDGGQSWIQQYHHPDHYFVDVFFLDSLTGWFVGWQEVLNTSDGGENWNLQTLPNPTGMDVEAIYFISQDTGWIAGSYKTIYVTYDGGENWQSQHGYELSGSYFLYDVHFADAQHGCMVGGGLLYPGSQIIMTTSDGGQNWTEIFPDGEDEFVKVHFANDTLVWAAHKGGALFKSLDGGYTWEFHKNWSHFYPSDMHFFNEDSAIIMDWLTQYATTDGWNEENCVNFTLANGLDKFSFGTDLNGIAVGRSNVMTTNDGGSTWNRINDRFYRIGFFDHLKGLIIQEQLNEKLLYSDDGGFNWTEIETFHEGNLLEMSIPSATTGYIITDKMELLKTNDAGETWDILPLSFDSVVIQDIQFMSPDSGFMCGPDRFFRTFDGGINWLEFQVNTSSRINDIDFINVNEGWMVISDSVCGHTVDGGETWDFWRIPSDMLVYVDFINSKTGFIYSRNSKMFRTVDGGKTWALHNQQFPYPVNIAFNDSLSGWLTDKRRIYLTADGGVSWVEHLDALSSNYAFDLYDLAMLDSNHAWVCTMDGRVFSLSIIQGSDEIVKEDEISYYPNPVTDLLTIELNNKLSDDLTIRIFSIDGRLMMTRQYPGMQYNRLTLHLEGLSTGLYLMNIQGPTISKSYKLVKE